MNIIIHFFNAILVFRLSLKLLEAFSIPNSLLIAYTVVLFWAIHPMHVEAVAWISGSKILFCTLFTLVSFNQFISAVRSNKWYYYLLSFLTFVISFYFKEQAIITPVMLLMFVVFYKLHHLKRIRLSVGETLFLLLSFGAAIYFGLYTIHVNYKEDLDFPPINYYPITQRVLLIAYCFYFYSVNLIAPHGLNYHREFPFVPYQHTPPEFVGYLIYSIAAIIVIFYIVWRSKNRHFYLLCLLIGLAQLSLELQVIPMTRPAIFADRYMYFPAIVFIAAITVALTALRKYPFAKLLYKPVVIAYLLYFTLYSNQMANYWHNLNMIR
ncbi:hypothetical protein [Niabella beijingensis]|uniref:hypothetical protein n=1 Tax=Niabella beijingensis TaxID=2872700 RepID=UPI001CC01339|nr:hypothetical protein [Niabella beijingensis]MBZ4192661.1 hypothetical protein [Niabella beijingensis]